MKKWLNSLLKPERWREIPQRGLEALRNLCRNLKKINSNPRWQTFKPDPAQGGNVTMGSVDEAIAGVECEEQGLLQSPLSRSACKGADLVDNAGQIWDVKTPPSYAINGKYIFNAEKFVDGIKIGYLQKESIVIDITKLTISDLDVLYKCIGEKLTDNEILRTVVVNIHDASMSKSSSELFKLLRG